MYGNPQSNRLYTIAVRASYPGESQEKLGGGMVLYLSWISLIDIRNSSISSADIVRERQNLSKVFSAVRWLKAYSYSSLTLSITHSFTDDSVLTWESPCLGPAILGFSNRSSRANASSLYTLLFYNLKKLTSIGGINGKAKFKKAIYRKWKLPWMAQGIINELSLFLVCTPVSLISKEYALLLFTRCLSLSASDMFPLLCVLPC